MQLEAPDGIHEIHQAVGQGLGKKGIGGPIMREGEESSRRLWALMGSRPYIGRGYGWTPRAYSWLTNLLLPPAPVLIDPPYGWETATDISNWHLIPSVRCLEGGGVYKM